MDGLIGHALHSSAHRKYLNCKCKLCIQCLCLGIINESCNNYLWFMLSVLEIKQHKASLSNSKGMYLPSCPCRCPAGNRSEGSLDRCTAVLGWDAPGPGEEDRK